MNQVAFTRIAGTVLLIVTLSACVTEGQKRAAVTDVNRAFKLEYERIIAAQGTRTVDAPAAQSFAAMKFALASADMNVARADAALGYINAIGPAPAPLTLDEWQAAADTDLPRMREIVSDHVGLMAWFVRFEPEGLNIVINATIIDGGPNSEVSLTARMVETAPASSGYPRREYLPPSAVTIGVAKIWRIFDAKLKLLRKGA